MPAPAWPPLTSSSPWSPGTCSSARIYAHGSLARARRDSWRCWRKSCASSRWQPTSSFDDLEGVEKGFAVQPVDESRRSSHHHVVKPLTDKIDARLHDIAIAEGHLISA